MVFRPPWLWISDMILTLNLAGKDVFVNITYPFYAFFSKKNGRFACFCPILAHYL